MKKTLLLMILAFGIRSSDGQGITSIQLDPPYPTSADSLRFYVDCWFPSGGCPLDYQSDFVSGNDIYASAQHCVGQLSVICNETDSFLFPPMAPGTYTFHFLLNMGLGPAPCTPGIVPGPEDSISFVITQPAGIPETAGNAFSLHYDPQSQMLTVVLPGRQTNSLLLYSTDGKWMKKISLTEETSTLKLDIPPGIYLARLENKPGRPHKFVVAR